MTQLKETVPLPGATNDTVVEVSLKQVMITFTIVFAGLFTLGALNAITRDLAKYKRQQALIEGVGKVINGLQSNEGETKCKEKTMATSSLVKK